MKSSVPWFYRYTTPQTILGSAYTTLGLGALLFPNTLMAFTFPSSLLPAAISSVPPLIVQLFGAQTVSTGILLLTCTMTRRAYQLFGLSLLPFLASDAFAVLGGHGSSFAMTMDGLMKLLFVGCCWIGMEESSEEIKTE